MIDVKIKNVSGLPTFETKIKEKGVYIVEGANTSGKSSFINGFLTLIKSPDVMHKIKSSYGFPEFTIDINGNNYGYTEKGMNSLITDIRAKTLAFCDSENSIINIISKNDEHSHNHLNKKIIELLGYNTYQNIQEAIQDLIIEQESMLSEIEARLEGSQYENISNYINQTKKEIENLQSEMEEMDSHISQIIRKKSDKERLEKENEVLTEKISNLLTQNKNVNSILNHGKNININEESITKEMHNIEDKINSLKEPLSDFKKELTNLRKKQSKYIKNISNLEKETRELSYKISDLNKSSSIQKSVEISHKIEDLEINSKCPYCHNLITQTTIDNLLNEFNHYSDLSKDINEKVSILNDKHSNSARKLNDEKGIQSEIEAKTQVVLDKIQDYGSFIQISQRNKKILEDELLRYINDKTDIMDRINKNINLIKVYQQDIDLYGEENLENYRSNKSELELQKVLLKSLEKKQIDYNEFFASKKSIEKNLSSLQEMNNYLQQKLQNVLKEFEEKMTQELKNISLKLGWNFDEIYLENGSIFVKRKRKSMDFSKLSTAERTSIVIIILYFMRKLLLPEFPFFFIDDVGNFDIERQNEFAAYLSEEIDKNKKDEYCFITRLQENSKLAVNKYQIN